MAEGEQTYDAFTQSLIRGAFAGAITVAAGALNSGGLQSALSGDALISAGVMTGSVVAADQISQNVVLPLEKQFKADGIRTMNQSIIEPAITGGVFATALPMTVEVDTGSSLSLAVQGAVTDFGAGFLMNRLQVGVAKAPDSSEVSPDL